MPPHQRTPTVYEMWGFFITHVLSSLLSYEPMVLIGKLGAASLFTIVYLFAQNIRSARVLRALTILLVASCMVSVLYTFGQYAFGRGVKVYDVRPDSPLSAAKFVSREHLNLTPILPRPPLLPPDAPNLPRLNDLLP